MAQEYFGKYTGIVESNSHDAKLGWIDVKVPTIFGNEEVVTARPALPFGYLFAPDKEQKVWIEFEGGSTELPLWTGVQYLQDGVPDAYDLDPPEKRVLHSPSGHVMIFNDKSGSEAIEIHDGPNGHNVVLNKDGITVSDGAHGNEVVLSSSGVLMKNSSGAKIELASSGITVDAGAGNITIKGLMIELKGTSSLGMPVLQAQLDTGIGNLGAPVPLIGPGNSSVKA